MYFILIIYKIYNNSETWITFIQSLMFILILLSYSN